MLRATGIIAICATAGIVGVAAPYALASEDHGAVLQKKHKHSDGDDEDYRDSGDVYTDSNGNAIQYGHIQNGTCNEHIGNGGDEDGSNVYNDDDSCNESNVVRGR